MADKNAVTEGKPTTEQLDGLDEVVEAPQDAGQHNAEIVDSLTPGNVDVEVSGLPNNPDQLKQLLADTINQLHRSRHEADGLRLEMRRQAELVASSEDMQAKLDSVKKAGGSGFLFIPACSTDTMHCWAKQITTRPYTVTLVTYRDKDGNLLTQPQHEHHMRVRDMGQGNGMLEGTGG